MADPNDAAAQGAALALVTNLVSAAAAGRMLAFDGQPGDANGGYLAFGRSFGVGSQTGVFVDQLTVREDHRDEMVITEHPVAIGPGPAPVSDHAYVRPPELTLECFWSNSGRSPTYARDVYARLLRLRNERTMFKVYTGKRAYANMLLPGLDVTTDESTEFALRATLHCRQIIVTRVQNFSYPADPANQSIPQQTQPSTNVGSTQTTSGGFVPSPQVTPQVTIEPTDITTPTTGANVNLSGLPLNQFIVNGSLYDAPVQVPVVTSPPT